MGENTFTTSEIFAIIDGEIKKQHELKAEYIKKNGYKHVDTLRSFDSHISALSSLYGKFKGRA